jgi:ABC-type transport system involved in multi-copper enzyme maturation permease subunit
MAAPSPLSLGKQLVQDTFRQAWASGISWTMLAGTAVCFLLCLSVGVSGDAQLQAEGEPGLFLPGASPRAVAPSVVLVLAGSGPLDTVALTAAGYRVWTSPEVDPARARHEGIETIRGRMTLAFGAISVPIARERGDAVRFLELLLAGGVAGTLGLLLALVWTAGFMPSFLDPGAASVLLAKPVPRWQLLVGKYLGVLIFLAVQLVLFVALTWVALGFCTDVWDPTYWWTVPLLLLQFAIFYSFSVLLAVVTRSTAACVVGGVLFWLLAWGINYGSVMARAQGLPAGTRALTSAAYWISPKPVDAGLILFDALRAQEHFARPPVFQHLESWSGYSPLLSVLSCVAIAAVLLALAGYELEAADY